MKNSNDMSVFQKALEARCQLALSRIPHTDRDIAEHHQVVAWEHAHSLGYRAHTSGEQPPKLISEEPVLLGGWTEGREDARCNEAIEDFYRQSYEDLLEEIEESTGSKEEWDALSSEEQEAQWESFHDLCAQGIADDMYFYRVMMNTWLVDYVGH